MHVRLRLSLGRCTWNLNWILSIKLSAEQRFPTLTSKTWIKRGISSRVLRAMLFSVSRGGRVYAGNSLPPLLLLLLLPLLAAGVGAFDCSRWSSSTHLKSGWTFMTWHHNSQYIFSIWFYLTPRIALIVGSLVCLFVGSSVTCLTSFSAHAYPNNVWWWVFMLPQTAS